MLMGTFRHVHACVYSTINVPTAHRNIETNKCDVTWAAWWWKCSGIDNGGSSVCAEPAMELDALVCLISQYTEVGSGVKTNPGHASPSV